MATINSSLVLDPRELCDPLLEHLKELCKERYSLTLPVIPSKLAPDTTFCPFDEASLFEGIPFNDHVFNFYEQIRPVPPCKEEDLLWGLLNKPQYMALTKLLTIIRPERMLYIGSGTGLIASLLAPLVGHMDAVDIDPEQIDSSTYLVNPHDREFIPALRMKGQDTCIPNGYYLELFGVDNVTFTQSDSLLFMKDALSKGQEYDFIVVDGNHATQHVFLDSVLAYVICKAGGTLWWDDFAKFHWDLPGITVAVQSLALVAGETFYYPRGTEWTFMPKTTCKEKEVLQYAQLMPFTPDWF